MIAVLQYTPELRQPQPPDADFSTLFSGKSAPYGNCEGGTPKNCLNAFDR